MTIKVWDSEEEVVREISAPHSPHGWIICHDTFLSGWGPPKQYGLQNWIALPVADEEEATVVMQNAVNRGDMRDVMFTREIPAREDRLYSIHDKSDYSRWYREGAF